MLHEKPWGHLNRFLTCYRNDYTYISRRGQVEFMAWLLHFGKVHRLFDEIIIKIYIYKKKHLISGKGPL